jgi:hypothetical protein
MDRTSPKITLNGRTLLRKPRLYQSCSAEEEEEKEEEEGEGGGSNRTGPYYYPQFNTGFLSDL